MNNNIKLDNNIDNININNNQSEQKLEEEKQKNKLLLEENQKLMEENQKLKKELNQIYNNNFNHNIIPNNNINNQFQNINNPFQNINLFNMQYYPNMINNYEMTLKQKDIEINELKNKLKNIPNEKQMVNFIEIMVINFVSTDFAINYGIKCLPDNTFAEIEEKLYQKNNEFRNTNNIFTVNNKTILRFKTLKENNIKDSDNIHLFKMQ